jgi:hypothetical protein
MHHKLHTNQPQCNNGHQNHGNAIIIRNQEMGQSTKKKIDNMDEWVA